VSTNSRARREAYEVIWCLRAMLWKYFGDHELTICWLWKLYPFSGYIIHFSQHQDIKAWIHFAWFFMTICSNIIFQFINQKVFEAFATLGTTLGGLSQDKSLEDTFSELFQPQVSSRFISKVTKLNISGTGSNWIFRKIVEMGSFGWMVYF